MTRTDERPRIAILWQRLSGYSSTCFAALGALGADVLVYHAEPGASAPFDHSVTAGLWTRGWVGAPASDQLEAELAAFDPHVILVSSWHITAYRRAARRWRGQALRVLCMDNQWWATPKQWAGVAAAPWLIQPAYDAVLLPGERQAEFARRLGFTRERTILGLYTAQTQVFEQIAADRGAALPPEAFLYVGRLVFEKGIDVLVDGYRRYRAATQRPWPLIVAGTGPLADVLSGVEGIELLGFVQPSELPRVFRRAGCLVLPSRFEPWAVVVHEATAAGLPVICTWVCGASTRLVLDDYNGAVVSPDNPEALARALDRVSQASDEERLRMGAASGFLARQFSPERWAETLMRRLADISVAVGLSDAPWHVTPVVQSDG